LRPGSGRTFTGSDSQVSRPITTVWPTVRSLNLAWSSGSRHGMPLARPMTPEVDWAQIRPTVVTEVRPCKRASYRDGCLDRRVRVVVHDGNVVVGVAEDRITWCQDEFRVWPRLAGQLLGDLLDVVVVDVAVAAGPDELPDSQTSLRSHHVREQRVACDVERHTEEKVGAALVELAGQPPVGDVELEERMAWRQSHLRDLTDVPRRDDVAPRVRVGLQQLQRCTDLVDVLSRRRRPRPPLHAVDRAQIACLRSPFVPDAHAALLQPPHVRVAA